MQSTILGTIPLEDEAHITLKILAMTNSFLLPLASWATFGLFYLSNKKYHPFAKILEKNETEETVMDNLTV